ncbi:MAG TPA: FAD binding domain-containing protein, partial [Gammaproteobacteria bacterium]|nr:FAD binding domain-containing protein [Gammaproteobacteria bacterium]
MIPGEFEYHAPGTIDEAVRLLGEYGDEAKVLAGGHSLLPMMKLRFAEPEHLVDLNRIAELRGVREEGGRIHIGAMTTEHQ